MQGLVLEGGGTRGAFQIGAWKALRELGVEINGVCGTSIGSINGAFIVQNDFDKIFELWNNITYSKFYDLDDMKIEKLKKLNLESGDLNYLYGKLKNILIDRGVDISPLRKLLIDNIDENLVRNSNKDFGIVTISLTDMKPLELYIDDIPKGHLIDYLIASSSLPIFKTERLEGKLFLDGGFYNKLPISLLTSKGYKDLIVVKLDKKDINPKLIKKDMNVIHIKPSESLGRILDFSQDRIQRNINFGYFDTLKAINNLSGFNYYVKPMGDENYFLDYFKNIDEAKVLKIGEILGVQDMPYKRMLFEYIIPKIAVILDIHNNASYEDIVLKILEEAAHRYNIERFKVYTFEGFKDEVLKRFRPCRDKNSKDLPNIFKQSDLVLKTFKKDILDRIIDELLGNLA